MKAITALITASTLTSISVHAELLCKPFESVAFSCGFETKSVSVCSDDDKNLIYRFGKPHHIELELRSKVRFSRIAYSGGGEGNLTFQNGAYKYVVYSSIRNGEWLDDGRREKIERAGIYVVKNDKLLVDIECKTFTGHPFITELPAYTEEPFRFYE